MDRTTSKIVIIGIIAGICVVASLLVLGLGVERENRSNEVTSEIGNVWGKAQTVVGPILTFSKPSTVQHMPAEALYVLPKKLTIESALTPEIRKRGIFETVVYTEKLHIHGAFSADDIRELGLTEGELRPILSVGVSDTRSIEKQVSLLWNNADISFAPGAQSTLLQESGIHTEVPLIATATEYPFSFELTLKGSEQALFVPLGEETEVHIHSPWVSPEFVGATLPAERVVSEKGFDATWRVSSFGRNYPQTWKDDASVTFATLLNSSFGVKLNEGVDPYTQVSRSIKYAILFIVITFAAFFLFEILSRVRIHPVQYLLIGFALALFYLLLLSLAEQIGFLPAYLVATTLTTVLITSYSASVLKAKRNAIAIFGVLSVLYGYLYFVLQLEDQALLFGSLLLFVLLATTMYLTRNIDWFSTGSGEGGR